MNITKFLALVGLMAGVSSSFAAPGVVLAKELSDKSTFKYERIEDTWPPTPKQVVVPQAIPKQRFDIKLADRNLRTVFQRWGREAGWHVVWDVARDIPIEAESSTTGTFLEVVEKVLLGLTDTDLPLQARTNEENSPPVLRVEPHLRGDRK